MPLPNSLADHRSRLAELCQRVHTSTPPDQWPVVTRLMDGDGLDRVLWVHRLGGRSLAYEAKACGGDRVCLARPGLGSAVQARSELERDLPDAIPRELFLDFQPAMPTNRPSNTTSTSCWRRSQ
jgi:hypothetical protein